MKTATVRDLRYAFPEIEVRLLRKNEITTTKGRRGSARPVRVKPKPTKKSAVPDFMARLKGIYGERASKVTMAEIVAKDRDR